MKISTKLKISFLIMIFLPLALFFAVILLIASAKLKEIGMVYDSDDVPYETFTNPIQFVSKMCKEEYNEITMLAENNPEMLENEIFLAELNNRLISREAYLVVEKAGNIIFQGRNIDSELLHKIITPTQNDKSQRYMSYEKVMVSRIEYGTETDFEGNVYLVINLGGLLEQIRHTVIDSAVALVVVIVITSSMIITWLYKSAIRPINKLRLATDNIKNGNLDFDMDTSGKSEFGELFRDFDEMKTRLRNNANEKIKTDADSREMISNISHDLKTPITAIKGYVEGIRDGVADTEEKKEKYLITIYNKACEMDRLIDELTFYSRIDSDRVLYNFQRISIRDYFEDCVSEIRLELDQMNYSLVYDNSVGANTMVIADPIQMKKVINNIVGNSIKYMNRKDGIISVTIKEDSDSVYIDIGDNGPGISRESLPYIFERFYRGDASRNSVKGGSGIGLSIVRKIVTDHSGQVWAESEDGGGTVIKIILKKENTCI